ncbi:hypothetical protein GCM10010345_82220 [Streptomyces canarius]|uniref:Uncharacterized protein n=1 Tax=Streptomyces canarius TaxID=285453 RepID=A0ABQ3D9F5_9ACTN|nr:hypothetical protein GCM10010345_82220 [Streptomyces canarius]
MRPPEGVRADGTTTGADVRAAKGPCRAWYCGWRRDDRSGGRPARSAVEAAGLSHLYPDAGAPWRPAALHAAAHPQSGIADLGVLLSEVGKTLLAVHYEYVTP